MTTTGKQKTNWPERLREISQYVNLTEEDRKLIRSTGPIVRRYADQLTTEVYDLIFEYPNAGRFFSYDDGTPDPKRVKDNKDSMMQWLNYLAQAPSNDAFARYLIAVSAMHRDIPIHRPGLPPVPSQFVIGTVSWYQTPPDPDIRRRTRRPPKSRGSQRGLEQDAHDFPGHPLGGVSPRFLRVAGMVRMRRGTWS